MKKCRTRFSLFSIACFPEPLSAARSRRPPFAWTPPSLSATSHGPARNLISPSGLPSTARSSGTPAHRLTPFSRCRIVNDKFTGRSRGFAFIDMVDEEAETAIKMMDGTSVMGRNLFVSKSAPPEKPSGFTERVPSSAGASGGRRDRPADPEDF